MVDAELAAYAAAGVETDHELTSGADLLAKLEAGLTIELRGSHEHLFPEFVEVLLALDHLPQTLTLCTDDTFPDELFNQGGVDRVIRKLIALGLPPLWVYRAATLNAATRIGRRDLGLVAPGRRADLVLLPDLEAVHADTVIADGRVVARDGKLAVPTPVADEAPGAAPHARRTASSYRSCGPTTSKYRHRGRGRTSGPCRNRAFQSGANALSMSPMASLSCRTT